MQPYSLYLGPKVGILSDGKPFDPEVYTIFLHGPFGIGTVRSRFFVGPEVPSCQGFAFVRQAVKRLKAYL